MWNKTIIAITALAALAASTHARPSSHNEAAAAIGGLITGVVLSDIIDDANVNVHFAGRRDRGWDRYDSDYRDYDYGRKGRHDYYDRDYRHHSKGGYYVWEKRRVWIPGHWEYTRNRCGDKIKIWVKGHHEKRRVKVWVNDHHRSGRYDRHDDHYRKGDRYCR